MVFVNVTTRLFRAVIYFRHQRDNHLSGITLISIENPDLREIVQNSRIIVMNAERESSGGAMGPLKNHVLVGAGDGAVVDAEDMTAAELDPEAVTRVESEVEAEVEAEVEMEAEAGKEEEEAMTSVMKTIC